MAARAMNKQETASCWSTIGVWGQQRPRCPRLEEVYHCRNCDVYTAAGRRLLERESPAEYAHEWAQRLALKKEERVIGRMSVVVFRVQEEWLAVPTRLVQEVTDIKAVHRIPHRNYNVLKGVVNIRGEMQLCVSLEGLLRIESAEDAIDLEDKTRTVRSIVLAKGGERYVLPVTEIHGVHRYHANELHGVPATLADSSGTYLTGVFRWKGSHAGCLDGDLLFSALSRSLT
ncbi:MAG: CheW protein [Gammaproteobacteria bacterium]|nr:MAG: CheW protein [Gammaproteobacteria bacterium]